MAANEISKIETVEVEGPDGPLVAIMVALDISDSRNAEAFILEVVEAFKSRRMCSPPETAGMLVTMFGDLSAEKFCENWRRLTPDDGVLAYFMSQMKFADVLQGTPEGEVLSSASLLD